MCFHCMKISGSDQWYQYLSTIGQTNAQVGYLALVFPVFAVFFVVSSERISTILYAIVVVLGEMAVILCGSDGIYAAIGGCMFFLLPFVWKDNIRMVRFLEMMAVFGIGIMLVSKTPVFAERLEYMEGLARNGCAVAGWTGAVSGHGSFSVCYGIFVEKTCAAVERSSLCP